MTEKLLSFYDFEYSKNRFEIDRIGKYYLLQILSTDADDNREEKYVYESKERLLKEGYQLIEITIENYLSKRLKQIDENAKKITENAGKLRMELRERFKKLEGSR